MEKEKGSGTQPSRYWYMPKYSKFITVISQNNSSTRASRFLVHFFDVATSRLRRETSQCDVYEERKHRWMNFSFSFWSWIKSLRIPVLDWKIAFIWQKSFFFGDVFSDDVVPCRCLTVSTFTETWLDKSFPPVNGTLLISSTAIKLPGRCNGKNQNWEKNKC